MYQKFMKKILKAKSKQGVLNTDWQSRQPGASLNCWKMFRWLMWRKSTWICCEVGRSLVTENNLLPLLLAGCGRGLVTRYRGHCDVTLQVWFWLLNGFGNRPIQLATANHQGCPDIKWLGSCKSRNLVVDPIYLADHWTDDSWCATGATLGLYFLIPAKNCFEFHVN